MKCRKAIFVIKMKRKLTENERILAPEESSLDITNPMNRGQKVDQGQAICHLSAVLTVANSIIEKLRVLAFLLYRENCVREYCFKIP
jgi:hypothetical protein